MFIIEVQCKLRCVGFAVNANAGLGRYCFTALEAIEEHYFFLFTWSVY
jgi:hypothetical protein